MKKLIVIGGPTASGKTALSIALAQQLNTVVVSADSRQFYKEMSIGTAKPSIDEMSGIPHFFIDGHSITDEVNASRFAREAEMVLKDLFEKHDTVILTGGSGMFIDALCYGLDDIPHNPVILEELNQLYASVGLDPLLEELKQQDPKYFSQVDRQNPVRVIRALEVIRETGLPYSSLRKGAPKIHHFEIHYFVLSPPRELLYERINQRVDVMIENGLEEEAKQLFSQRYLKPLATVGYTEWFRFFDGEIDKQTCIDLIKQNSRRYAKRQVTWFKRNENARWIPYGSLQDQIEYVMGNI
jgi:tRNA dimethylallyltransferase